MVMVSQLGHGLAMREMSSSVTLFSECAVSARAKSAQVRPAWEIHFS